MSFIQSVVAAMATLALLVVLFGTSPVQAETDGATDEVAAAPVTADEKKRRSKLVCKRERKTGSRVREKVCRTVGQIEDRAKADRTDIDLMTRNARPGNLGT